jgi:peptidoglycan/xylan/chitin deacetylase (PgdA/CDA1 family)
MDRRQVLMFHYVRHNNYKNLEGLHYYDIEAFERNIVALLDAGWAPGDITELSNFNSAEGKKIWFSFDDGYIEHYELVAPILNCYGIRGIFFVPTSIFSTNVPLLPNRIHVVLAKREGIDFLYSQLLQFLPEFKSTNEVKSLRERFDVPGRFDSFKENFVKRVLQRGVSNPIADLFLDQIAESFGIVWGDVHSSLYLSANQTKELHASGHFVGYHGHQHHYYEDMDREAKEADISAASDVFRDVVGIRAPDFIGYPYGSYDAELLDILNERGIYCGFIDNTTNVSHAHPRLTIPRRDCNYINELFAG